MSPKPPPQPPQTPAPARIAPPRTSQSSIPKDTTSSPPPEFTEWRKSNFSKGTYNPHQVSNYQNDDVERATRNRLSFTRRGYSWYSEDLKYSENMDVIRTHALKIVIYLFGPVFFVTLGGALWTLISVPLLCLIHPLYLLACSKNSIPLRERIVHALEPFIYVNLYFISSSARTRTYDAYSIKRLLGVLLLSPMMSLGMALAAWTAAFFWLFTVLVGDPQGTAEQEKRSSSLQHHKDRNDGRESVMWCRSVWRDWMVRSLC